MSEGGGVGRHRADLEILRGVDAVATVQVSESIDADRLLAELMGYILEWEQSEPGSDAEQSAAAKFTGTFAVLDKECTLGNVPERWRWPVVVQAAPVFSDYQQGLIALFGTCPRCAGPRNTRNVTDGANGWRAELYCTICGLT